MDFGQPGMSSLPFQHSLPALPLDILGQGLAAHSLQQHRVQRFIHTLRVRARLVCANKYKFSLLKGLILLIFSSSLIIYLSILNKASPILFLISSVQSQERIRDRLKGKNILEL